MYVYIYIYIERERDMEILLYYIRYYIILYQRCEAVERSAMQAQVTVPDGCAAGQEIGCLFGGVCVCVLIDKHMLSI